MIYGVAFRYGDAQTTPIEVCNPGDFHVSHCYGVIKIAINDDRNEVEIECSPQEALLLAEILQEIAKP